MNEQQRNIGNQPPIDFGDDVPYAFDYLPINHELNKQIYTRAMERAKEKIINQQQPNTEPK